MGKTIYTSEYKNFAQKLRKAREDVGLTQVEVAKIMKESQSFISKVEAGQQRLDILEVKQFAKLYKKDISFFL
ncbi:helix-turn-helix transcriptional regulator [bacterium]|nr:helix-turn-helix transcriptional regulator [bacterium]